MNDQRRGTLLFSRAACDLRLSCRLSVCKGYSRYKRCRTRQVFRSTPNFSRKGQRKPCCKACAVCNEIRVAAFSYAEQLPNFLSSRLDQYVNACWVSCRIAGPISSTLASKVLKQRPGTVQRAKDVYLALCELEQADTVVVRHLKPHFRSMTVFKCLQLAPFDAGKCHQGIC